MTVSTERHCRRAGRLRTVGCVPSIVSARIARQASGLRDVSTLREPSRVVTVRRLLEAASGSELLAGLVDLAARVTGTSASQLSLLADEQVASAIWHVDGTEFPPTLGLQDSMCSVTVVSGDVLVAGDTRAHPWLGDLLPVTSGLVRAYLGVPLALPDGTCVGALCVWEHEPRTWSGRDVELTCAVADLVALELARLASP